MREIKFRLILQNKIVGYEWHKPLTMGDGHIEIFHSTDELEWFNINYNTCRFIDHDNKNQFTGLKDKNGVDIYNGDILRDPILGDNEICEVVWDDYGLFTRCECDNHSNQYDSLRKRGDLMEVISNIYQNPELLNNTSKKGE